MEKHGHSAIDAAVIWTKRSDNRRRSSRLPAGGRIPRHFAPCRGLGALLPQRDSDPRVVFPVVATTELRLLSPSAAPGAPSRDAGWYRAARRARLLSWASLGWTGVEGVVGLIAGVEASSLSLIVWASSSFVEGLASMTIIWRFTGTRLQSATSERTAQRWVAGSFLLLVPYFLYASCARLLHGSDVKSTALGIAVT